MAAKLRRVLGIGSLAAFLVGIGVALHHFLPPRPLWRVEANEKFGGFVNGGENFFTYLSPDDTESEYGPIRLRETKSGAAVATFWRDKRVLNREAMVAGDRYFAAITEPGAVHVIDFRDRRELSLPADGVNSRYAPDLSPNGSLLSVHLVDFDAPGRTLLFELPSGKPLQFSESLTSTWFSPSGRYLVYETPKGKRVWDCHARQHVEGCDGGTWALFSADDRRLALWRDRTDDESERIMLWDLEARRLIAEIPADVSWLSTAFSPDGRWIITKVTGFDRSTIIEFWDTNTGQVRGRYASRRPSCSIYFGRDSDCVLVDERESPWRQAGDPPHRITLTCLELPGAKVRWQRPDGWSDTEIGFSADFSRDGRSVRLYNLLGATWEFLDSRTGETRNSVLVHPVPERDDQFCVESASADRRRLLAGVQFFDPEDSEIMERVRGWLGLASHRYTVTVVIDGDTSGEIVRLETAGDSRSHLTPDGELFVMRTEVNRGEERVSYLEAWPIPLSRPWAWIIGIPAWLGVLLFGARYTCRRRQNAPADAGQPAA
jgi:hypothetical protein